MMKWPPTSFAFGVLLSVIAFGLSLGYYLQPEASLSKPLTALGQKTIDWRLRWRGPSEEMSSQVALLTVDETALNSLGRWPWSRDTIAQVVESAMDYGVKVLAFDMVFSEANAEDDDVLTQTLRKYPDRVVLGYAPEGLRLDLQDHFLATQCESLWRNQQITKARLSQNHILVSGFKAPNLPPILQTIYEHHLTEGIADHIQASRPAPQSALQRHQLEQEIVYQKSRYCQSWLDPERDELFETLSDLWFDLGIEDSSLDDYPDFATWAEEYRNHFPLRHDFKVAHQWIVNLPQFHQAAPLSGHFAADQDADGVIRSKTLLFREADSYLPNLALNAFLVGQGLRLDLDLHTHPQTGVLGLGQAKVVDPSNQETLFHLPTDSSSSMLVNYQGPRQSFAYLSAAELLDPRPEAFIEYRGQNLRINKAEFLKDRLLIFGASALGIYDLRVTPFDENYPGPEIHVTLLDNLLRQDFLSRPKWEAWLMPWLILAGGLLLSFLMGQLGAMMGLIGTILTFLSLLLIDRFFLFGQGVVVNAALPFSMLGFVYLGTNFYNYLIAERGKRELKQTFQKYVSPAIVDEILKSPENIELGGKKLRVSVFFSDVRGFTTISEKLDPRSLSDLLNSYLTPMTDLVFEQRGTLDKYMGDAIMAFFGAPLEDPDHATNACLCALEHLEKLKVLQAEYRKKGLPEIDVGIGINTGEVSVGNMGSQSVRSYTVMGDAVNLASRLEGINKQYGTRIVISEFTYADVKDKFVCRELDWVRVKGKAQPVGIYELMAQKGKIDAETEELLRLYNQGFDLYHQQQWGEAQKCFAQALNIRPDDTPSRLYVERCQDYLNSPPAENWDGVFVMTSK